MIPLTQKQNEMLIYLKARHTCPSFEEMRVALRLKSKAGVHRLIGALEERGFVRRLPNRARAIEVCEPARGLAEYSLDDLLIELERRLPHLRMRGVAPISPAQASGAAVSPLATLSGEP